MRGPIRRPRRVRSRIFSAGIQGRDTGGRDPRCDEFVQRLRQSAGDGKSLLVDRSIAKGFGFKGYVVSDSAAVEYLYNKHGVAADMKDAVRESINAGLNVKTNFTQPDDFILPLRELVKEGKVTMQTLDDRVRDVLRVKFTIGLFDHPYVKDAEATERLVNSAEHQAVALRAARESMVLLKNDKNILPLSKDVKSIAVIGPNANDDSNTHYRYGPTLVKGVTVFEGIKINCRRRKSFTKRAATLRTNAGRTARYCQSR